MTPERKALFQAAPHHQGGHSAVGADMADALGVPFPIDMANLVPKARLEGENPAALWPWLIEMGYHFESTKHRYFTAAEIVATQQASTPRSTGKADA